MKTTFLTTLFFLHCVCLAQGDIGELGDIKYSILEPDNFQRIHGQGWVVMEGPINKVF